MGLKTKIRKLIGRPKSVVNAPSPTLETLSATYPDIKRNWLETYLSVRNLTMTSPERIFAVCQAVEHLTANKIEGDFVECGVWRGGSSVAMLRTLLATGTKDRELWLYDTFEGMSQPTDHDVDCFGRDAADLLSEQQDRTAADSVWCEASLQDVQANINKCNYPAEQIHYVAGKVEDTIPNQIPDAISLLRLDTDWFDSTWHELVHLYPRLVSGGVLIIDDYGHWQGCREAVDQYLAEYAPHLFLNRIDYTGRIAIKP